MTSLAFELYYDLWPFPSAVHLLTKQELHDTLLSGSIATNVNLVPLPFMCGYHQKVVVVFVVQLVSIKFCDNSYCNIKDHSGGWSSLTAHCTGT